MHTPILKQSPFLNKLSWKAGDGPDFFVFPSSFRIYPIWFIFMQQKTRNCVGSCPTVKCAERIFPKLELHFDAYSHLEAVAVSKQIELEGWGLAQPLHLFEFFQNLPYLVHLYATGDSQSHPKSPNRDGAYRISPRPERLRCIPPSWSSRRF